MVGHKLGHYRIVEKIGEGGMGTVYRAHDERLDRDVALKLLTVRMLADEATGKRFRKEALALSKLNHPSVATVFDFDSQDGIDFLVMEYVSGVTLKQKLATGALPEKEVLALGAQVAEALQEAHEQGIVHRDLKPGNIMVTPKGRAKALDFGLAKLLRPVGEATTTESFTETQTVAGTLPYMAPEQLRGESADPRSDIYAAGAVLYEMATGQQTFREELAPRLTDAILHQPPVPPRALNARVSAEVERIILKCLEKDPENRYQSAKELLVDLRRLMTPSMAAPVDTFRPGRQHRRYALVGAGLAVVLLLGVVVGLNVGGLRNRLLGGNQIPRINSLAVLPLENLSGDKEQEYFADGMTDMLTTDLAQVGALRVTSLTSAMLYKQIKKPLPEIARELNVDAIVQGSVLRAGDRVRITAQLIYGPSDRHLWAQTYEGDMRDILALQGEVARTVTREIGVTLTPQRKERLTKARAVNPQAQEAYLRGAYAEDPAKGQQYLQQAMQLDPAYALPYVALANLYYQQGSFEQLPPKVAYPKAKEAALKALSLDENLADAHGYLALVTLEYDWNFAEAEKGFQRALELNPNQADVRHSYAHYLLATGRPEESAAETQRAAEIDPVDLDLRACVGWHCIFTGKYREAEEHCRRVLQIKPDNAFAHLILGWAYEQQGRPKEASAEFEKRLQGGGDFQTTAAALGHAYAVSGRTGEAEKVLAKLIARSKHEYVSAYEIAVVYVGLGDKHHALDWLEKAYEEHSSLLVYVKLDPRFQVLHADPRFQDLVRRLGIPP